MSAPAKIIDVNAGHTIRMGVSDEHGIYLAEAVLGEPLDCGLLETLPDIDDNGTVCAGIISAMCTPRRRAHGERRAVTGELPATNAEGKMPHRADDPGHAGPKLRLASPPRADLVPVRGGPLSEESAHTETCRLRRISPTWNAGGPEKSDDEYSHELAVLRADSGDGGGIALS